MLLGDHHITINGVKTNLQISAVLFTAQGLASFYGTNMSDEGIRTVDIGFGTLDLFSAEDGEIRQGSTAGYPLGASFAVKEPLAQTLRKTGVEAADAQALQYLLEKKTKVYYSGGGSLILQPALKKSFQKAIIEAEPIFTKAVGCYRLGKRLKLKSGIGLDPGFYAHKAIE